MGEGARDGGKGRVYISCMIRIEYNKISDKATLQSSFTQENRNTKSQAFIDS